MVVNYSQMLQVINPSRYPKNPKRLIRTLPSVPTAVIDG